jgi:hypothetical protein
MRSAETEPSGRSPWQPFSADAGRHGCGARFDDLAAKVGLTLEHVSDEPSEVTERPRGRSVSLVLYAGAGAASRPRSHRTTLTTITQSSNPSRNAMKPIGVLTMRGACLDGARRCGRRE